MKDESPTSSSIKLQSEKALALDPISQSPVHVEIDVGLGDPPDGGLRAWLVILGTMCNTFSTFGLVNSWGVFQAYYEETLLKDYPPSTIAWIGSIQYSLVFIPGLITGRLFDIGYFKIPYAIASVVLVVATFLVAECTQFWQLLLCQGLALGFACGVIYPTAMAVISHWFKNRRGLALGLTAAGSSIGGTVFPIAAKRLINEVGFPWTMRILGFVLLLTLGVSNVTLKRRLPPKRVTGGLFNLGAFKNMAYTIYCLSGFVTFLGLYTVLTYIEVSAISVGVDPNFAFYLISIASASSLFGRLFSGIVADRTGALNVMTPLTLLAGATTYIWPYLHTKTSLIILAIFYGFGSGAYVSLLAAPMIALGGVEDVGRRVGMGMTILALGALAGPPISGAVEHVTGGYKAVGIYAGSMVMVSAGLMVLSRQLHLKCLWGNF